MQRIDEFKKGNTVWCAAYGQGEITEIDPNLKYPVTVYFYDGKTASHVNYTLDGKLGINGQRVLYFAQPRVEGRTTRPFISELIGSYVMCVSNRGRQAIGIVTEDNESSFTLLYYGGYEKLEKSALKSINKITIEPTNYV